MATATAINWSPLPWQHRLIACPAFDVFAGGARGPGKSAALLGDWLAHADDAPQHARGLLIRRTYPEMEELEEMAHEVFPATGGTYRASSRLWRWPDGAFLRLRHLERDDDAGKYLGHSYTWIGVDEVTQWSSPAGLDKLRGTLRSAHGVPTYFRCTGNPGGPGHNWVRARYVDPAPPNTIFEATETIGGDTITVERCFIPATLDDNYILTEKDPGYWQRVAQAAYGREDLLKAWRYGLWDIVAGGALDDLWHPAVHVLAPFRIPDAWYIDRTHDWGSSKPFATLWFAESNGEALADGRTWPKGTLFVIAEDYGWNGKPNEGCHASEKEIADRVKAIEVAMGYRVRPGPGDVPDDIRGGVSVKSVMLSYGLQWLSPNKGPGSRVSGLQQARSRLLASKEQPMEQPGLFVFETCRQFLRTVPVVPRDTKNPDDVDSNAEDHLYDALTLRLRTTPQRITIGKMAV